MAERVHERFDILQKTDWDFFTMGNGRKTGYLTNISRGGCLLKSCEPIEHRRWLRMIAHDEDRKMGFSLVGRVVRREDHLESVRNEVTLYRYGIEFTFPGLLLDQDLDLILALSSKNLSVDSCLIRNNKSSLRSGFLA